MKLIFSNRPLLQQANTNAPVDNAIGSPMRLLTRSSPLSLPCFSSVSTSYTMLVIPLRRMYYHINTMVRVECNILERIAPRILVQQYRPARKVSLADTPEPNILSPARYQCSLIPRTESNPRNVEVRNLPAHHRDWRPTRRCKNTKFTSCISPFSISEKSTAYLEPTTICIR